MSTSPGKLIAPPSTARGQLTRIRLLEAAEAIFGEKGYDRASITDITQRAGVAQGTFYVYFVDKKAVFVELVRDLSHRLRREIAESVAGLNDRIAIERQGFLTFFEFITRHRNLYRIVRQAEFVDEELYRWYYDRMARGYVQGLEKAMESHQIRRMDLETLAYCLMGMCDLLGMRWVLWRGECPPPEVIESMLTFVRRGMEMPEASSASIPQESEGGSR